MNIPINPEFHTNNNFREQLCMLTYKSPGHNEYACSCSKYMLCNKSLIAIGDFGSVQFNNNLSMHPAEYMDYLVEKNSVIGFYHTHPEGFKDFSSIDTRMQETLAISCGKKPIWHVVQALNSDVAKIICYEFLNSTLLVKHDLGFVFHDPFDTEILLPTRISKLSINQFGTVIVKKGAFDGI